MAAGLAGRSIKGQSEKGSYFCPDLLFMRFLGTIVTELMAGNLLRNNLFLY